MGEYLYSGHPSRFFKIVLGGCSRLAEGCALPNHSGTWFLPGDDSIAIPQGSGSQSVGFHRVKAIYLTMLRHYVLLSLSLSHEYRVEFSRGYLTGDITAD